MKKSRRITILFAILCVCICFAFIGSVHARRSAFRQSKAEILVSAGYSPSSNVIVWRENGYHYVNGRQCTEHTITSAIDSLIRKDEDYEMVQFAIISFGLLCLLLFGAIYNQVKEVEEYNESLKLQVVTQEKELHAITESSMLFFEQEAIRKKRATVHIYDYATDKAHPLDSELFSSEENKSEDSSSEDNKSEEAEESEE